MCPLDLFSKLLGNFRVKDDFLDANLIAEDYLSADEARIFTRSRVLNFKVRDRVAVWKFLVRPFFRKALVVKVRIHLSDDEDLIFVLDALEVLDLVDKLDFLGFEEALEVVPIWIFTVVALRL